MRQEVYVKFAEALAVKKAADRARYVHVKFAEAIQARQLQKQSQLARAAGAATPALKRLSRALLRLRVKASPKVNASTWFKLDPRRLFTTTRHTTTTATNFRGGAVADAVRGSATQGAYGAYSGGGGGRIRAFGELEHLGGTGETTRISPAKILTALGLGGLGAGIASSGGTDPTPPSISDKVREFVESMRDNHKLTLGLAAGGLGAGAVGAGALAMNADKKKEKPGSGDKEG
jgi:hypothetical protein